MKALVLRTSDKDGRSYGGFQWPLTIGATVTAPDWNRDKECGNGLHGWLYGQGDYSCSSFLGSESLWWVIEIESEPAIALGGKVKFQNGIVCFFGGRKEATDYLHEHEPKSRTVAVIGAVRADLTAGANVFVGALGHATAGYRGTATAGDRGTATAGYRGTATAGDSGTATAGDRGTATAGHRGTATAGDRGTATAGDSGTATAGEDGVLSILWYDGTKYRRSVAVVGESGIKANTPYHLDGGGKFIEGTA